MDNSEVFDNCCQQIAENKKQIEGMRLYQQALEETIDSTAKAPKTSANKLFLLLAA